MSDSRPQAAGLVRLHWLVAVLVGVMLVLGQFMSGLPRGDALKGLLLGWHLGVGLSVLGLAVLWLVLRLRTGSVNRSGYPAWRRRLIFWVHAGLFVLMLGLPLAGLSVYLVDPHLGGPALLGEGVFAGNLSGDIYRAHYLGAWLLLTLLVIHISGALWPGPGGAAIRGMLPGRRSDVAGKSGPPSPEPGRKRRRRR